ncbi:MAG: hypothetical protein JXR46_04605 [Calditrichaceae bacterium]|nr:hypothetical protein [Calditrichaceae bacterium]MBN2708308.1 hypothetical protein [Calditrichaceae bacterium]RQV97237.1 MAG: hypothetical protein EH224_02130 [Calditrichota bacterium]
MAKKQDFASKTMKLAKHGKACPVCGEFYNYAVTVDMVPSKSEGSYRFVERNVSVCKCNEKEVYS